MRLGRLSLRAVAAWLGIVALTFDALVPVHLAFDLSHSAEPGRHHETPARHGLFDALLTLVAGHRDEGGGQSSDRDPHHGVCAVCGAAATLAGFAPAAAILLSLPAFAGAPKPAAPAAEIPRPLAFVAYRSRAPPFA